MNRSRDHGRELDAERAPAAYSTGTPPKGGAVMRCACGAYYRDYPESRDAHLTVHAHRPINRPPVAESDAEPAYGAA